MCEFIPQAKKKGSEKKRLIFSLKTNERSSFLRGYLLASTTNSPTTVVLPFINMIESIKEKQPELSASPVEKE